MTEDRKPAKPGMSEVSPKFVDAAEAATTAPPSSVSVPDDPLVALGQQWKEVYGKWIEADVYPDTSDRGAIRKYEKERTVLLLTISQLEDQAAEVAAQTVDGVLAQLRMAGTHYHLMERDGEQWANTYAKLTWQAWNGLKRLVGTTAPQDTQLEVLAADYYAAYIARDAATDAREEVEHQAEKLDSEAIRIEGVPTSGGPDRLFLPFLFDSAGTPTPTREQVSQYCDTDKLTEAVMRHLEEYGERCVAALEAAGWPEKQAEFQRAEQRVDTLFDRMVQTPAQGLRGIAAKMKGLVYPHEWEFLRDGKLDDFDDQINTEMFVSLVADVERLAGKVVTITKLVIEDPVLALKREWDARYERFRSETDEADKVMNPLHDRLMEAEFAIHRTPATTPAGVAVKIWLWACTFSPDWETPAGQEWWEIPVADMPDILDHMPIASALQDLERMAEGGTATRPAAVAMETGLGHLAALEREWREAGSALCDATEAKEAAEGSAREALRAKETIAEAHENLAWKAFLEVPCRTFAGVLLKMRVVQEQAQYHSAAAEGRVGKLLAATMRDLGRLVRESAGVTKPPVGGVASAREQIDQLQHLVTDAAAPLPSIMKLLGTEDFDIHLLTVRDLVRVVDDRMAKVADAAGRLQSSGKGAATRRQTVTTAAAGSTSDPVAQIGRDLAAIWRRVWRNEEELSSAEAHSPERTRLENLESHLADRREALEAMAAEVQTGSLEGVMVQIMLTHAEADVMAASTEESNEAQMRTISKLLYSTLAALEQAAGVPREKLGGEAYLTRELDPHALVAGDEIKSTA